MIVLGIETSCDETGVAIYDSERGLLGDALYSQIGLHAKYGGVVPELASRDHVRKLLPIVNQAIEISGINKKDISGVAYTAGPGLVGAFVMFAAQILGFVGIFLFAVWIAISSYRGSRRNSDKIQPAKKSK